MEVKFEYLGEDVDSPNAKIWKVEAIHVTTTRNKRKFTKEELEVAGRSLSFRPLNINHETSKQLDFPENSTRAMHFNPKTMAVEGSFRVVDPTINAMIETGRINAVSIEQIPTLGETCNEILCEQHGVAFIGMALLESDVPPGDPGTVNRIRAESTTIDGRMVGSDPLTIYEFSLQDLLVSDTQRECKECTDFQKCDSCSHKEFDEILEACLAKKQRETPEMPMDMRVTECLEELNRVDTPQANNAFRGITIQLNEQSDCVDRAISEIKDKHKDWPQDKVIAVALDKCGQSKPEMAHYFYKVAKEKLATP